MSVWEGAAAFSLVALLLIVAVWLVAVAYLGQAQTDALKVAASERRNVALALASQIEASTAQVDDVLLAMRRVWLDSGREAFRREDLVRSAPDRGFSPFEQIVVFDADGRIAYTTPLGFVAEKVYVADVEHFAVHRRLPPMDELHIGRPFFGRLAKRWHVQMTRPIIDADGRFVGVIAASMRPERFAALHRGISLGPGGVIAVVRETGEYVARTERYDEVIGRMAEISPALAPEALIDGEFQAVSSVDGIERVHSWRKVANTPLLLYVGQPIAEIMTPVEALRRRVYAWLGGFTILSGGLLAALTSAARQNARALTALRDSEKRFRSMFEKTNSGIVFTDPQRRLLDCNEAFERLLGCGRATLLGCDFAAFSHPDDMAVEARLFSELLRGERLEYRLEKRYRAAGGGVVWVDLCVTAVRDDDGAVRMLVGTAYDITERKDNETALAASNAELEQFGYVASHDLRQPLRMVSSYLTLLERAIGGGLTGEPREFLNYARDGARRMDQMLVSLLEYSRVGRRGEPMSAHDSRALLDEALLFVGPDIEISGAAISVSGEWPQIFASRNEMVRLFQNLLSNALKYRAPDHPPQIKATAAACGDGWLFSVEDDGIGFPPDQVDRLFKVFQRLTTRDQYDGSGVGLAVCRKIVERHGGRIWAESPGSGGGAAFRFTLPPIPAPPPSEPSA